MSDLPDNFWRKSSEPEETSRGSVTTDNGNTVEVGMETEIRSKFLSSTQPAKCKGIYFRKEKGSWVLVTKWRYTEDAESQFVGKSRVIEGYNIDYSVFQESEFDE